MDNTGIPAGPPKPAHPLLASCCNAIWSAQQSDEDDDADENLVPAKLHNYRFREAVRTSSHTNVLDGGGST